MKRTMKKMLSFGLVAAMSLTMLAVYRQDPVSIVYGVDYQGI